MAEAPPPPLQIPATPIEPCFLVKTVFKVAMIRAPEAPNGCPRATAPPSTFTFSGSSPRVLLFAMATTEKASLIS